MSSQSQTSKSESKETSSKSIETKIVSPFYFDVKEIKEVGNIQDMQEERNGVCRDEKYNGRHLSAENSAITLPLFDNNSVSLGYEGSLNLMEDSFFSVPSLSNEAKNETNKEPIEAKDDMDSTTLHNPIFTETIDVVEETSSTANLIIESNLITDSAIEMISPLSKVSKFRTRNKEIGNSQVTSDKKVWKGTVGEIGRKAKKVEKEKKIVFKKR